MKYTMQEDKGSFHSHGSRDFLKGILMGVLLSGTVFLAAVLFRFGTFGSRNKQGAEVLTSGEMLQKLEAVQSIIRDDALEQPDSEELEAFVFRGIAVGLNDAYAQYFTPEEEEASERRSKGSYRGIGVVFQQQTVEEPESAGQPVETEAASGADIGKRLAPDADGIEAGNDGFGTDDTKDDTTKRGGQGLTGRFRVVISDIYEDGPAQAAGVRKGDELKSVDGQDVTGASLDQVMEIVDAAYDAKNTVVFSFRREGKTLSFSLEEAEVALSRVESELLGDGIGYIRIPEFDSVTGEQFRESCADLKSQAEADGTALRALVLDVRDNPGGILESVTGILDDLLDECVLLTTSDASGVKEQFTAKDGRIFDGQMAVLVNGNSASAAEVFAGVLQQQGYPVVGTVTYGKGTVQHTYSLFDGSAFKLTSLKYAVGGTDEIDGVGIIPDVEMKDAEVRGAEMKDVGADKAAPGAAVDTAEETSDGMEDAGETDAEKDQNTGVQEEIPDGAGPAGETDTKDRSIRAAEDPALRAALDLLNNEF